MQSTGFLVPTISTTGFTQSGAPRLPAGGLRMARTFYMLLQLVRTASLRVACTTCSSRRHVKKAHLAMCFSNTADFSILRLLHPYARQSAITSTLANASASHRPTSPNNVPATTRAALLASTSHPSGATATKKQKRRKKGKQQKENSIALR